MVSYVATTPEQFWIWASYMSIISEQDNCLAQVLSYG
jgi:hypothetical protein